MLFCYALTNNYFFSITIFIIHFKKGLIYLLLLDMEYSKIVFRKYFQQLFDFQFYHNNIKNLLPDILTFLIIYKSDCSLFNYVTYSTEAIK